MTDNQDPLTIPPKRQIGEKTAHPLCGLTTTLAAGVRQIEVLATVATNLWNGCTIQLSIVALPEPPVHENWYAGARKGQLHRLNRSLQVRYQDGGQPVVATALTKRRCVAPPSVGEAAWKTPCRYSLLAVLGGRVRFVDDLYGHDANRALETKVPRYTGTDHSAQYAWRQVSWTIRRSKSSARALSAALASPLVEEPCMTASVVGSIADGRRMWDADWGVLQLARNMSSVCAAGPTKSSRQRRLVSHLGEQLTAEQGAGGFLVEDVGTPPVGDVRRVDAADGGPPRSR